ncbi:hypothetical protein CDL15_Pgr009429 [Punica granatum]|uniref:non-specific serine/threonine protein kinase n=2 Tax=Punica granatum TaxID=22663 RepID=A0A218WSL9_PUNGR|nr:hypothetical protein CDL15_Pgr009429 [Punica granatum]
MGSDGKGESLHKHRRSSPSSDEEAERTSKRHKHRHHRHSHRSRKHGEETKHREGRDVDSPPPPPAPISMTGDDLEEGEILEEEAAVGLNSHNPGDDGENGVVPVEENSAVAVGPLNERELHSGLDPDGNINGDFVPESHEVNWKNREPTPLSKDNGNQMRSNDVDSLESEDSGLSHSKLSSGSAAERYKASRRSHSRDRYKDGDHADRRSHLVDSVRERSHSRSILLEDEDTHSKTRHRRETDSSFYDGKHKSDYDLDDQRKAHRSKGWRHDSRDTLRDERRERSSSYSRYDRDESRHHSKERDIDIERRKEDRKRRRDEEDRDHRKKNERERSMDREWERDRKRGEERGSSMDRVIDRNRRRDQEREMSRDRSDKERERTVNVGRRERERDRSRDRTREIDSRRYTERERDRSRDRTREIDRRRYSEREMTDRDRTRGEERKLERGNLDDRHSGRRRAAESDKAKYEALKYGNDDRSKRSNNSRGDRMERLEGGENKQPSNEDEDEDLDESVVFEMNEPEEEDVERIKEESRRRRQAILETYKNQHQPEEQQKQLAEPQPENSERGKRLAENPGESIGAANAVPGSEGADFSVRDLSFSIKKSPQVDGTVDHPTTSAVGLGEGTPKSEHSEDMFYDDIFGESPAGEWKTGKGGGLRIERSGLHDNWDDAEGYYSYRFGEILDGRYEVIASHGQGVFSNVVRCRDLKAGSGDPQEVAVKILRNKEAMYKSGVSELGILNKLVGADPDDKRHCVRLLSNFKYRNHLCLVFESLNMNLREVLKKFGRDIGLKLTAVRAYAKQLFIALKHLRNCGVLHSDIKPDNMLVNEAKNVLKLCDFGNAMYAGKNEITPYLVSRFYRAPEIILGLPYDHPIDMWSVGCSLYELYTGKVLFPGSTNNEMIRLFIELKGPFSKKMLRKGAFVEPHFDQDLNYTAQEEDPVTKQKIKRVIPNIKQRDIGSIIKGYPGEDPKMLANFKDLLDKIFVLDPDKRMTVHQALNHPFITGK